MEVGWASAGDPHFNLFYTYKTHHLEDNVTRAFILTLRALAPTHLRLFLREVILKRAQGLQQRIKLLEKPEFHFDLQVTGPSDDNDKLDAETGVIVGVDYSGKRAPTFNALSDVEGGARPDALLSDIANGITALFEIKLSDTLYHDQIQRHFRSFFLPTTSLHQVFVEITWSEIARFLDEIGQQSAGEVEKYAVSEFVQYLDLLELVDFFGFQSNDFARDWDVKQRKLNRFLVHLTGAVKSSTLELKPYNSDFKLWFADVPYQNIWLEMLDDGISCGIVCGSGKKWRASQVRADIISEPDVFRLMLDRLRQAIDVTYAIVLRIHSYFHYSRFRTAWLGDIGGTYTYPDNYNQFLKTLENDTLNSFAWIKRSLLQDRFAAEIKNNLKLGRIEVDEDGKFPIWQDVDSLLQYTYFHVDILIPSTQLVNQSPEQLRTTFNNVLGAEHEMMRFLNAVMK